jgi:hypothetical protein
MNFNATARLGSAAWAVAYIAAASSAFGQSTLDHMVVQAHSALVTVNISQSGAGKLGTSADPITLRGDSSGLFSLSIEQVGASGAQASLIKAYSTGNAANAITLKQQTTDATPGAVNDVWAKILLGTQDAPAANQHVALLQTGDKAQATIEAVGDNLSAYIVQQGSSAGPSSLTIASNGANNTYGTAGTPIALGALSTLTLSNTGASNSYAVSLAESSSASITHTGSFNTYNIATQLPGDSLSLAIHGSGNTFTFDFPTIGANQYKAVAWGNVATPASLSSGNFVAQCGGSLCWVSDTSSNGYTAANLTAAANASVTPR